VPPVTLTCEAALLPAGQRPAIVRCQIHRIRPGVPLRPLQGYVGNDAGPVAGKLTHTRAAGRRGSFLTRDLLRLRALGWILPPQGPRMAQAAPRHVASGVDLASKSEQFCSDARRGLFYLFSMELWSGNLQSPVRLVMPGKSPLFFAFVFPEDAPLDWENLRSFPF